MSPTCDISASSVRSKYAYLFRSLSELYRIKYGNLPSTKFADVKVFVSEMERDGCLSDFLIANIGCLFQKYPEIRPGSKIENNKLCNLDELLNIVIGDICTEISENLEETRKHDQESLLKWLEQQ